MASQILARKVSTSIAYDSNCLGLPLSETHSHAQRTASDLEVYYSFPSPASHIDLRNSTKYWGFRQAQSSRASPSSPFLFFRPMHVVPPCSQRLVETLGPGYLGCCANKQPGIHELTACMARRTRVSWQVKEDQVPLMVQEEDKRAEVVWYPLDAMRKVEAADMRPEPLLQSVGRVVQEVRVCVQRAT